MSTDLREQLQATLGSNYTLERELGGGGMSRVFVAQDARLGRRVVGKASRRQHITERHERGWPNEDERASFFVRQSSLRAT